MNHTYPAGITLRAGCEGVVAVIEAAEANITRQMKQISAGDKVGNAKGDTILASYKAFRMDLQALLDHTALQAHALRDRLVTQAAETWQQKPGPVNVAALIEHCVDLVLDASL